MAKRNQKARQQSKPRQQTNQVEYLEGKFWFGNVHIHGIGVVSGRVRNDHLEKFKAHHKKLCERSGLPVEDQPELNINYWVRDVDELELKKKRDRKPKTE